MPSSASAANGQGRRQRWPFVRRAGSSPASPDPALGAAPRAVGRACQPPRFGNLTAANIPGPELGSRTPSSTGQRRSPPWAYKNEKASIIMRNERALFSGRRVRRKYTWPAVVVSSFLPVPRAIIGVIAGWAGMRLVTFLILDLIGAVLWAAMLAGLGYALGHQAVAAARTISHYSWWFTIGIVALSVLLTVRSQRRLAAAPADQKGG